MINNEPTKGSEKDFIDVRRSENSVVSDLSDQGKLVGEGAGKKSGLAFLLTRPLSKSMARLVARHAGIITEEESEVASDRFPDIFNGQQ